MTIPPTKLNLIGGGVDISLPNVSYCEDVKDVHYLPYNLVRFYVGEITRATPQTVNIYTDSSTSVDVEVSEGNKWYSYVLPKDKGLYKIEGDSVKKVVVKANISTENTNIIPSSTIEASFKGCKILHNMNNMFSLCTALTSLDISSVDTSKVTSMDYMFDGCNNITSLDLSSFNTSNVTSMKSMFEICSGMTSLDLSNFDTSKVTSMYDMFLDCNSLTTIRMVGCSEATVNKIKAQLTTDGISLDKVNIITE